MRLASKFLGSVGTQSYHGFFALLLTVRIVHKSLAARVCMRNVCGIKRAKKPEIFYILFHSLCIIILENKHTFLIQTTAWSEERVCAIGRRNPLKNFWNFSNNLFFFFICNTCGCCLLITAALVQVSLSKSPVNNANELTIHDCFT